MATYLFQCEKCEAVEEISVPRMEPPKNVQCTACWALPYMHRVFTAPHAFTHQTGAEWLNEVAEGRGDPPAGMTREEGKRAALAKARSDHQMKGQSGKQPKTISTALASAMRPYTPE